MLRAFVDVGMFAIDLDSGELRGNPGFLTMWSLERRHGPLRYEDLLASVHADDRSKLLGARQVALSEKRSYRVQYRIVRPDGAIRHVRGEGWFAFDESGKATSNFGVAIDVTSEVAAELRVLHLLEHDRLTDLIGRNAFIERLQRAVLHHEPGEIFGVLVLDLDRFSALNDTLGSSTGDAVLRSFATRLKSLEREGHSVARIGGDEFACLLRGHRDERHLFETIDGVRALLDEPVNLVCSTLQVSASLGLSVFPADGEDIALLERAHLACYKAKPTSGDEVSRYRPSMELALSKEYEFEASLHDALANREFEVYYQPIVDATNLQNVGIEALVRWNHPRLGLLSPDAFFSVAETMGIAPMIDAWVLTRACLDASMLPERSRSLLKLHVNVSAASIARRDFVDIVRAALGSSSLRPQALALEITEQSLIVDRAGAARKFATIREFGAEIAIDDFGIGYNGLLYLKDYVVDCLKIDRTFVLDLETSSFSRGVCSGIVALARNLKLKVVAEGVESAAQATFLKSLGVHELQGYLFGRPTDFETLAEACLAEAGTR